MTAYISFLNPQSFTEQDVEWLAKGGNELYHKMGPMDFVKGWNEGRYQFWAIDGGPEGMLVTSLNDWPDGRELFVNLLVGKGLVKVKDDLKEEINLMAKRAGCKFIGCEIAREGLWKLYSAFGYRVVSKRLLMEV